MATGNPAYDPTISSTSSLTPPATIDGTGLTTTVPLLVKNGNTSGSGVEVQVTGTAKSGFLLRDSGGTLQGEVGLAVSASDWTTNSAANDIIFGAVTGNAILKAGSTAGKGAKMWSFNNTGLNAFYVLVDDATGVKLGFGATNFLLFDSARAGFTGPIAIDNSNSLTAVRLQYVGDANTGYGQIGGADTTSTICGGVEILRAGTTSLTVTDAVNFVLNTTTGTKLGTGATQKLGFWNATPVVQPTNGVNLTNSVTTGGTDDTIADYSSLTVYATDAAAIRNNIYQLAKKLKVVNDALRTIGIMS